MRIVLLIVCGLILGMAAGSAVAAREGTGSTNFHPEPLAVINRMTYQEAYNRGMDFRLQSMWKECVPYMLRAVQLRPDDCDATNRLAECYLQTQQLVLAERRVNTLERYCHHKSAVNFLHFLLYWLQKRHDEAFEHAYKVSRRGPAEKADAQSWLNNPVYGEGAKSRAWKFQNAGQEAKAERVAYILHELSPKITDKQCLALILWTQHRPEEARAAMPPPMDVFKHKLPFLETIGVLNTYIKLKEPRTFAALQFLSARYPNNPHIVSSLLTCCQVIDNGEMLRKAWPIVIKFVQHDPSNYDLAMQGLRWASAAHKRRLTVDLAKALADAVPGTAAAHHCLAIMYQTKARPDDALAEYALTLELTPKAQSVYMDRGVIYNRMFMADEAIKDFTTAIKLDPSQSYFYQLRGECYQNLLTDNEKARADFARCKQLNEKR